MIRTLLALLVVCVLRANAFSPAIHQRARSISSPIQRLPTLSMSDNKEEDVKSKISADGTFYDDEVDSAPVKQGISDSMRDRLIREASTGLDSNKKQDNVILYIIGIVGVLVVLGGSGILY
eukprot:CAMPEP_0198115936 /NCGR_PEP_ID=MMETSP1442-20131203/8405_1 /TAXON_ID= /ORGANISM="Craspedostauros australis, Strain CCMP3328" /LENGTH=120 /DNA_ID=CAMNT_0043773559 /DNA_START=98 /DNA_END=460 /DNA_ORIENTATION=-